MCSRDFVIELVNSLFNQNGIINSVQSCFLGIFILFYPLIGNVSNFGRCCLRFYRLSRWVIRICGGICMTKGCSQIERNFVYRLFVFVRIFSACPCFSLFGKFSDHIILLCFYCHHSREGTYLWSSWWTCWYLLSIRTLRITRRRFVSVMRMSRCKA